MGNIYISFILYETILIKYFMTQFRKYLFLRIAKKFSIMNLQLQTELLLEGVEGVWPKAEEPEVPH